MLGATLAPARVRPASPTGRLGKTLHPKWTSSTCPSTRRAAHHRQGCRPPSLECIRAAGKEIYAGKGLCRKLCRLGLAQHSEATPNLLVG